MGKRFTEISCWDDPWYQELSPTMKCLWKYICDQCDCAGVWKINRKLADFQIGAKVDWSKAEELLEGRVICITKDKWLVVKFLDFQYGSLSSECRAHIPVFKALEAHGLQYPLNLNDFKGYQYPIDTLSAKSVKGIDTLKEKEKEKEEEKDSSSFDFDVGVDVQGEDVGVTDGAREAGQLSGGTPPPPPAASKRKSPLNNAQQGRFDKFWAAYPKKVSKRQAEATWGKIDPDDTALDAILAAIDRARKHDRRFREPNYTPHASTWLNSGGWEDEIAADDPRERRLQEVREILQSAEKEQGYGE